MSFFFYLFQAPSALEMAPTALETIGFYLKYGLLTEKKSPAARRSRISCQSWLGPLMWSIFQGKSQTCGLSFEFSAERRKYTGSTRTGHWEPCCATRLHILLLEVFSKCYQLLSSLEACKLGENLAFEIRLLKVDCIHTSTNVTRFRCPHPSSKVSNCS